MGLTLHQKGASKTKRNLKCGLLGFLAGALNGIFGAGGGLLVVPMLEAQNLPEKESHATSIAIILPLSLISAGAYLLKGVRTDWGALGITVPLGLLGAAAGAFLLKRMPGVLLKKLFAAVMILSAVRLLLR